MKIEKNNITMVRGDTEMFKINLSALKDGEREIIPFEPGDRVFFTVKKNANTKDILIQKIIQEFTDGAAVIHINHADTADLSYSRYVYDIQIIRGDVVKTIVPLSYFTLTKEVTHDGP